MKFKNLIHLATIALALGSLSTAAQNWEEKAIAPVVNSIFFESPLIQNEIRPLFAYHRLDKSFLGADVDVRVYAVQLRYTVNDRLALIATKDGYLEMDPGPDGWGNVAAGLKYAVYKSDENQCVVTPGLTFEIPTGSKRVFQGRGDGEVNIFVSAVKGWDNLHATINLGARVPFDLDAQTASLRYCGMVDYYVCQYFIPFVSANAFTTISEGNNVPFNSEGFDVINFGSANANGDTQAAFGIGFRSRLEKKIDIGFAYERGWVHSSDIFKDRVTVDLIYRF